MSSDSAGNYRASSSTNFAYGAGTPQNCFTASLDSGVSEADLCLETDGRVTIKRTLGSNDIEIVMRIMWI